MKILRDNLCFCVVLCVVFGTIPVQSAIKKDYLIKFWFYSPNPNGGLVEVLDNYNESKIYDPKLPTKIVTHGFRGSCTKMAVVLEALQQVGRSNNICIDWDAKTSVKQFFDARNLVPLMALYIANMITGMRMNPVHCIGHSLGAHICHMTAAKLMEISGQQMQQATLCDPAVIQGDTIKRSAKKITDNIILTEVIHTNIETTLFAGISGQHLGYSKPMGDYDFYPNGGYEQPSCHKKMKCEHSISYYYYAEALKNPMAFPSSRCTTLAHAKSGDCVPSDVYMGNTDTYNIENRGIYWLSTSDHSAFQG